MASSSPALPTSIAFAESVLLDVFANHDDADDDAGTGRTLYVSQWSDTKLDASAASAFGLTLIDDADAAAARTTLGLGDSSVIDEDALALTGNQVTSNATDYFDDIYTGGDLFAYIGCTRPDELSAASGVRVRRCDFL